MVALRGWAELYEQREEYSTATSQQASDSFDQALKQTPQLLELEALMGQLKVAHVSLAFCLATLSGDSSGETKIEWILGWDMNSPIIYSWPLLNSMELVRIRQANFSAPRCVVGVSVTPVGLSDT